MEVVGFLQALCNRCTGNTKTGAIILSVLSVWKPSIVNRVRKEGRHVVQKQSLVKNDMTAFCHEEYEI